MKCASRARTLTWMLLPTMRCSLNIASSAAQPPPATRTSSSERSRIADLLTARPSSPGGAVGRERDVWIVSAVGQRRERDDVAVGKAVRADRAVRLWERWFEG